MAGRWVHGHFSVLYKTQGWINSYRSIMSILSNANINIMVITKMLINLKKM
jgi:hypothetical protein